MELMSKGNAKTATGKVRGRVLGTISGITVTAHLHKAKTLKGKNHVWIQLRQNSGKPWRIGASLSYVNAADIRFEETETAYQDRVESGRKLPFLS